MKMYKFFCNVITLEQGSKEWLLWRKDKIGASDAPIIMGKSPFKSALELFEEKMGGGVDYVSQSARTGTEKEPEARLYISELRKKSYAPIVLQSKSRPWVIASLDGIGEDGSIIEIKCPGESTIRNAFKGFIPEYYLIQVQHQMFVTGANEISIFVYNHCVKDLPNHKEFTIQRDEKLIEAIIEEEEIFFKRILDNDPPPRPFVERGDFQWETVAREWLNTKKKIREMEDLERKYREELILMAGKNSAIGCGVRVSFFTKPGAVEYSKIPELKGVDLSKYRKPKVDLWRVTEI